MSTGHGGGVPVRLTWPEVYLAAQVGIMRHAYALKSGLRDRGGIEPDDGWSVHVEGAGGELAYAKAAGLFWSGTVGELGGGDVGAYQVRTRSSHGYDLLLYPKDPDAIFVLVTGRIPDFVVRGWIHARDGKRPEWWACRKAWAYWVPQASLVPGLPPGLPVTTTAEREPAWYDL